MDPPLCSYDTERFISSFAFPKLIFNNILLFFNKYILIFNFLCAIIWKKIQKKYERKYGIFPLSAKQMDYKTGGRTMYGEKLIRMTKLMLDGMFYCGIAVIVTLPLSLRYAGRHYSRAFQEYYVLMMRTVEQKNCFVSENVKSLEVMGITSAVIVALFFVKCFFLPTPATFIIVLTFFIAGLFSGVLSFVFREAIRYKEENDLTI